MLGCVNTRLAASLSGLKGESIRRFDAINRRFDDIRAQWRAALRRMDKVPGARLKRQEER
jgi:hypothetical protein